MRTYYEGPTYTVAFDESDTACFTQYTDATPEVVRGQGAFVFDTLTGELVDAKGAAKDRQEMEWLAFSQDAQDFARDDLRRHGVVANPFDFGCDLPEISNPARGPKTKGGKAEVGRPLVLEKPGMRTRQNPGAKGHILNVDDDGDVWVEWENGDWSALGDDDEWSMPTAWNPAESRISRTRGIKGHGPFSSRRGYKPWIQRRGTLGEGFLVTMSKAERHKALDSCVAENGYRSCLGKIMALERAHKGPRGKGVGVGVRYAKELAESRAYLRDKYGGEGSFGPQTKPAARKAAEGGPGYTANPEAAVHRERAFAYLEEAKKCLHNAVAALRANNARYAHGHATDAHRNVLLAEHEAGDAQMEKSEHKKFKEAAKLLRVSAEEILAELAVATV